MTRATPGWDADSEEALRAITRSTKQKLRRLKQLRTQGIDASQEMLHDYWTDRLQMEQLQRKKLGDKLSAPKRKVVETRLAKKDLKKEELAAIDKDIDRSGRIERKAALRHQERKSIYSELMRRQELEFLREVYEQAKLSQSKSKKPPSRKAGDLYKEFQEKYPARKLDSWSYLDKLQKDREAREDKSRSIHEGPPIQGTLKPPVPAFDKGSIEDSVIFDLPFNLPPESGSEETQYSTHERESEREQAVRETIRQSAEKVIDLISSGEATEDYVHDWVKIIRETIKGFRGWNINLKDVAERQMLDSYDDIQSALAARKWK